MKTFVSTDWLYKNHGKKNLIIFDCSWHIPNTYRNPLNEFKKRHIKNSQFFDIDKISNQKTKLPHMAPPAHLFQNTMRSFGVNNKSKIVWDLVNDLSIGLLMDGGSLYMDKNYQQ